MASDRPWNLGKATMMTSTHALVVVLVAAMLLPWTVVAVKMPGAIIKGLKPWSGSMAGGTYLVIRGVGFARGGVKGTTKAYMLMEKGVRKECVQNQGVILDSTDINFVCWTPPWPANGVRPRYWFTDSVKVQVVLTADDGTESIAYCDGDCTFHYGWWGTPSVGYASQGGVAGSVVKAFGAFFYGDITKYWMRIGGDHAGGGVGGALCAVDPRMQMGANGNGGASKLLNDQGAGTVLCRLGVANATSEAGRYPLHIEPRGNDRTDGQGYGQPFFSVQATQTSNLLPQYSNPAAGGGGVVPLQSMGFGITIWPLITGVSVTNVGLGGGVVLTITGAGFSTLGNNQVTLGNGVPCTVTSSHMNSLTCVTGASPSGSPAISSRVLYPGGTGLMQKVYIRDAYKGAQWDAYNSYIHTLYDWFFRTYEGFMWGTGTWRGALKERKQPDTTLPAGLAPHFAEVNADSLVGRFGYYGSSQLEWYTQVRRLAWPFLAQLSQSSPLFLSFSSCSQQRNSPDFSCLQ